MSPAPLGGLVLLASGGGWWRCCAEWHQPLPAAGTGVRTQGPISIPDTLLPPTRYTLFPADVLTCLCARGLASRTPPMPGTWCPYV